jgi:hypothetical protein
MRKSDLRQIIREEIEQIEVSNHSQQIAEAITQRLNRRPINEAIGVISVLSYVLASNTVLHLISKLAKRVFKKYDFGTGEAAAKKIYDITHKIEKAFVKPIEMVVRKFTKDAETAHKVSEVIFALLLLVLAGKAGAGAFNAIKSHRAVDAAISTSKVAMKGVDIATIARNIKV